MNKFVDLIYGIPSDRQTQEPPTTVANDRSSTSVLGLWLSTNNSSLNTLEHKSSEQKSGIYLNTWEITEKYAFNAHFQDKGVSVPTCLHWDSTYKQWVPGASERKENACNWGDPDDRVEGHVLIFSCKNIKTATSRWTTFDERMLDPTRERHPTSKGKGEAPTRQ